jgi:PAS domain S-box-containing protein
MDNHFTDKESSSRLFSMDALFRFMVESVKDYAIFALTADNRVVNWNPGAARIFGYLDEEIIGQSGAIIFTPEDRERGEPEREIRTALAEGRAEDDRWHLRKDGSRFFASGVMAPLLDEAGRVCGFIKVARDITEQRRLEEQVRRHRDELEAHVEERTSTLQREVAERGAAEERARGLLSKVVKDQEDERLRIARDLHDHLGQQLTALKLKLEALSAPERDDEQSRQMRQLKEMVNQIDADLDFLVWELRPARLAELGLTATLENFVSDWSSHFSVPVERHIGKSDLWPEAEICLYRIAQEALNNIGKHSGASQVLVLLEKVDGSVRMVIEDNGKGFHADQVAQRDRGLGLIGMRERAELVGGKLEIESVPNIGTTIYVSVPLSPSNPVGRGGNTG